MSEDTCERTWMTRSVSDILLLRHGQNSAHHGTAGELTGDDEAGMYWTLEDYIESVVLQHGLKLVGWPPDIPFQNLSNVRGGAPVLAHLQHRWDSGILRFVPIAEDERMAACLNAEHLAPAPKCAHRKRPGGREDIGRGRYRYKTNPYNLPLRRPKTGPKTPKFVPPEWDD